MDKKYASQAKYDAVNTKHYGIKLNFKYDADIIAWLESHSSKQGAIKKAIRLAISEGMDYNEKEDC